MIIRIHRATLAAAPTLAVVCVAACIGACSSDDSLPFNPPGTDARADVAPAVDAGEDSRDGSIDAPSEAASDAGPLHVVSSDPGEGAAHVYPVEIYDQGPGIGVGERKRIAVAFSAPMDTASTRAELTHVSDAGAPRAIDGVWAPDGRGIVFTVLPPNPEGHPLEENAAYRLDLRAFRDAAGRGIDATTLGDAVLDFSTGAADPLLNHACQHTLYGPYTNVTATAEATGAPNTSQTHREYTVTLPSTGEGFTRFRFGGADEQAEYVFYFGSAVPVQIRNEAAGAAIPLAAEGPTPPACPGITHFARFSAGLGVQHSAKFGPIGQPSFKFIIEAL